MKFEVSIVIPLYNKQDVIWQTLESVSKQTYGDWECIIVNDGSTDQSLSVVESFIKSHSGSWRVINQHNQGQVKARNNGITNSVGNFLAFLDADDLWLPDKLADQVIALKENPRAAAVLASYAIFGNGSFRIVRHSSSQKMLARWLDMSGFGGGLESVGLVRRSALMEVGLFDSDFSTSSGLDLTLRLSKIGEILILSKVEFLYRLSQGQWHTNAEELNRNTHIIYERYRTAYRGNLATSHSSYIFWTLARQKGHAYLLSEFIKSLFRLSNGRARMLIRLISRNLKASLLGRTSNRTLERILTDLESKNSN